MSLDRALELAERGRGTTHPNPIVGAVLVREGEFVGEGWHERQGGPHAEVNAIAAAGEQANGSTMYVTMEPCSHHGKTPPCVDAVVEAGIAKVVAGSLDPHPDHGGGRERLRAAGVEVELVDSFARGGSPARTADASCTSFAQPPMRSASEWGRYAPMILS